MKFGVCASFQDVRSLNEISFDYLEESVQRFLMPERSQDEFEEALREARKLPIPVETANVLFPPDLYLIAPPDRPIDTPRINRYMQTVFQRAEQAGIRVIVFGSGGARSCPAGFGKDEALRQLADHLANWNRLSQEHGVTIALEPLRYEESNVLNTVAECGELIAHIANSGARFLVDTYHMSCNHEDPATLLPWKQWLAHVHVAEYQERAAPGVHGEDFYPYFKALKQAGYDRRISIECHWRNFSEQVNAAVAVLREQWAQVDDN